MIAEAPRDLLSYCGLYCGDCFTYRSIARRFATRLRRGPRDARRTSEEAERIAEDCSRPLRHYRQLYEGLGAVLDCHCASSCRQGGGTENCPIRDCSRDRGHYGCWECDDLASCSIRAVLDPERAAASSRNIEMILQGGLARLLRAKRLTGLGHADAAT